MRYAALTLCSSPSRLVLDVSLRVERYTGHVEESRAGATPDSPPGPSSRFRARRYAAAPRPPPSRGQHRTPLANQVGAGAAWSSAVSSLSLATPWAWLRWDAIRSTARPCHEDEQEDR